jgi:hypothetical protein
MMKKQIYTLTVYLMVMEEFADLDAIYEDAMIHLVGIRGVEALKENKLLESCGVVNGRQMYTLCDKFERSE